MKSRYELPITIYEALEKIIDNTYLLPAIQRKFVWKSDQIERLFDSIMRDIPLAVRKALPHFDIAYLGIYKEKKVYGYAKRDDDGSGFGMPYVVLYDGIIAEKMYLFENEELCDKFYK